MIHLLPPHPPGVDDGAEAVRGTLLARQAAGEGQHAAQRRLVAGLAFVERGHMRLGDHEEVHRGDRVDVVEGEDVLVLVDLLRGDLAAHDLAEDAVRHLILRPGFFLVDAGDPLAAMQLGQDVVRAQAEVGQQHKTVEPQVGGLAHDVQQVLVLGRHDGLGGLLRHLLADGVGALVVEARHVGRVGFGPLALLERLGQSVQHTAIDHL